MNGIDEFLNNLISETERMMMNLSNVEGSENVKELIADVQDAIKNGDVDKLNQIVKEHGDNTEGK